MVGAPGGEQHSYCARNIHTASALLRYILRALVSHFCWFLFPSAPNLPWFLLLNIDIFDMSPDMNSYEQRLALLPINRNTHCLIYDVFLEKKRRREEKLGQDISPENGQTNALLVSPDNDSLGLTWRGGFSLSYLSLSVSLSVISCGQQCPFPLPTSPSSPHFPNHFPSTMPPGVPGVACLPWFFNQCHVCWLSNCTCLDMVPTTPSLLLPAGCICLPHHPHPRHARRRPSYPHPRQHTYHLVVQMKHGLLGMAAQKAGTWAARARTRGGRTVLYYHLRNNIPTMLRDWLKTKRAGVNDRRFLFSLPPLLIFS